MIYWGVLLERNMYDQAVTALMKVAYRAGKNGYPQIHVPQTATEWAREEFTRAFLELSNHPLDTLVMLDADHDHPADIVERLAETPLEYGVIAALAFTRMDDARPAYYIRDTKDPNYWYSEAKIPQNEIVSRDMVGTGAIAIRRWVFEKLKAPYWKKMYDIERGGEDWYFSLQCEQAGIERYVHTGVEIPHFKLTTVRRTDWENFVENNL